MNSHKPDDGAASSNTNEGSGATPQTNSDAQDGASPAAHADESKGAPHSDRHAAETLAGRLENKSPAEVGVPDEPEADR